MFVPLSMLASHSHAGDDSNTQQSGDTNATQEPKAGMLSDIKKRQVPNKKTREGRYKYTDYGEVETRGNSMIAHPSLSQQSRFPSKLYAMLSSSQYSHIISWLPHGRSWKIWHLGMFEELVLPHFFESSNYASFVRLVNAWSFRRVKNKSKRRTDDFSSYYHELFLRGRPDLHIRMKRLPKKIKKVPMDKEDEPDFSKLKSMGTDNADNTPSEVTHYASPKELASASTKSFFAPYNVQEHIPNSASTAIPGMLQTYPTSSSTADYQDRMKLMPTHWCSGETFNQEGHHVKLGISATVQESGASKGDDCTMFTTGMFPSKMGECSIMHFLDMD